MRKIAALLLILSVSAVAASSAAARGTSLAITPSVSDALLVVHFKTAPHSNCSFVLGSGSRTIDLPNGAAGRRGRGVVTYKLSSGAPVGQQPVSGSCARAGRSWTGAATVAVPHNLPTRHNVLTAVLNTLLDALLAGSLVLFGVLLVDMVVRAPDPSERFVRSMALVAGAIVALGAQAAGVGFADYTVNSLTGARPSGEAFKTLAVIVPGGIAAGFGWYFVRVMKRSAYMGMRLMSFLGMLTVVAFAVIFAQATNTKGVILGSAAIPNASFVAGLILSIIFFLPAADAAESGERFAGIRDALRRRASKSASGLLRASEEPPAPVPRNPFADD